MRKSEKIRGNVPSASPGYTSAFATDVQQFTLCIMLQKVQDFFFFFNMKTSSELGTSAMGAKKIKRRRNLLHVICPT